MMFRWMPSGYPYSSARAYLCCGIAALALVWLGALVHLALERQAVRQAIFKDTGNLSHVLEERVMRAIGEADRAFLLVRSAYERTGGTASWSQLLSEASIDRDSPSMISVIDENGSLLATGTALSTKVAMSLSDSEFFRVHANNNKDDVLFISQPFRGDAAELGRVVLTRKFDKPDGNFGGVIAVSLDPQLIPQLHDAVVIDLDRAMMLIGRDGVVRAAHGNAAPAPGTDLSRTELFARLKRGSRGSFWQPGDDHNGGAIVSYRALEKLPLVVAVSAADEESVASFSRHKRNAHLFAGLLSALFLVSVLVASRHALKLDRIQGALSLSEIRSRAKSRELELTLNHMSQGIMMVDGDGQLAVINRQAVTLLGLPGSYLKHPPAYADVIDHQRRMGEFNPFDVGAVSPWHGDKPRRSAPIRVPTHEWTTRDGTVLEVRSQLLPDGGFVRTFTDVTGRYQTEARINHLIRHDALTNLANRAMLNERLACALSSAGDRDGVALLCINLDLFRVVNDALGYTVGDELLRLVAGRLQHLVGRGDLIARLGGDEFALVHRLDGSSDPARLAQKVIRRLSEPFAVAGHNVAIGASIGIARATADVRTAEDLLVFANLALAEAKASPRPAYRFYEPQMHARIRQRHALERDLRKALTEREFELHYQPLYRLDSQEISGFEALIRWRHPHKGLVLPAEFVPLAEDIGLIEPIGAWALEQACQELARMPDHLKIAVNLSPIQFRSSELVRQIKTALADAGAPAHRLVLEITESTLLCGDTQTLRQLHELRNLGARIAMDDFGTGYSSLSYLLRFPFDSIKIDRSFVSGIGHIPGSTEIIRTITELASNLGMTTIAEGVESAEQLRELMALGCCEAQGYWWSPPVPAQEVRKLSGQPVPKLMPAGGAGQAAA